MTIVMHDLAGADPALRFSPYCWRTRMALAHKGLAVETIPWRFTEKDALAFSGQGRVPVIRDGDRVVSDSWAIAEYLEDAYPDRPSLFGGANRARACPLHQRLGRRRDAGRHRPADRARPAGRGGAAGRGVFPRKPRGALRHDAGAGAGGARNARGGVSRGRFCRCGWCWAASPGSVARRRATPTTSCSARCNGRAASAASNCWKRMIRSPAGGSACWICSTGSGGARRAPDEVRAAQAPIRCSTSSRRCGAARCSNR